MASSPTFASTPRIGIGQVSVANTARDGTGTVVSVLTAVAAGTRIERIAVQATDNPADSIVTLFLHDGTNFRLWSEIDLNDPAVASATSPGFHTEVVCRDLVLPSGWSLRAAITAAPTAGVVNVIAFGADLT